MSRVDHYMVEYLTEADTVAFANEKYIYDLTAAKALASKTSKTHDTGAYAVAFAAELNGGGNPTGHFTPIGHISFFDGKQSETDGIVI